MAENDKFKELSGASQKADDAQRIALINQDVDGIVPFWLDVP